MAWLQQLGASSLQAEAKVSAPLALVELEGARNGSAGNVLLKKFQDFKIKRYNHHNFLQWHYVEIFNKGGLGRIDAQQRWTIEWKTLQTMVRAWPSGQEECQPFQQALIHDWLDQAIALRQQQVAAIATQGNAQPQIAEQNAVVPPPGPEQEDGAPEIVLQSIAVPLDLADGAVAHAETYIFEAPDGPILDGMPDFTSLVHSVEAEHAGNQRPHRLREDLQSFMQSAKCLNVPLTELSYQLTAVERQKAVGRLWDNDNKIRTKPPAAREQLAKKEALARRFAKRYLT